MLVKLTSEFCCKYIDQEYAELCEKVILKMSRKRSVPFLLGKPEIWAAGVIHAVGYVNFLFDSNDEPYVDFDTIADHFNTSKSTVGQKSKIIRDMFKIRRFDNNFSTQAMAERNPYNNLFMLDNGMVVTKDMLEQLVAGQYGVSFTEEGN
ncbi:MAG: hypothetical protein H6618_00290 [Deltaproteobacteria bacterium]|nr:hypothetical protein [Deltaproteobacteria bacterium]